MRDEGWGATSEDFERVAEAIYESGAPWVYGQDMSGENITKPWTDAPAAVKDHYRENARAALAALAGGREQPEGSDGRCLTCKGERQVVVNTFQAGDQTGEEYGPCPDCSTVPASREQPAGLREVREGSDPACGIPSWARHDPSTCSECRRELRRALADVLRYINGQADGQFVNIGGRMPLSVLERAQKALALASPDQESERLGYPAPVPSERER